MRVAVMSDIHGFSLALDTVMDDVAATGPYDLIVVAGDLCEVGPNPAGVLSRLREHPEWVVLKGNTDDDLVSAALDGDADFAATEIGPEGIAWLAELPFSHRVPAPGHPDDRHSLLIVHANPHDLRDRLDDAASDSELEDVLGDAVFDTIAFGHVHISYQRQVGDRYLVDVSAVGNPKDGDLRCAYGVFEWSEAERRWLAEIRRLDYPLEGTLDQIRASALEHPDKVARVLQRASY